MKDFYPRANLSTNKDFYGTPYKQTATAWVDDYGLDNKGRPFLVLSNTIFYPHGGGQKGDRGVLRIPPNISANTNLPLEIPIIDTRKEGDFVRHIVDVELPTEAMETHIVGAQEFEIEINWAFRYKQMRLHSIAHLLHCFTERVLCKKKLEFPSYSELQEDYGVNRYPTENIITAEQLVEVVAQQNAWMAENHPILIYANDDPELPDWYRWWECDKWKIPCGGVHPSNTNEIGDFSAELISKKGNTTIKFSV